MTGTLRLCVVLVIGWAAAANLGAGQAPVFRASADAVTVGVSVRRANRAVVGLQISDFDVFDNGVAQQVADLSFETLPIDVTVLLDISGSVTGAVLDQLRRAVVELQGSLKPNDRLHLVTFNMRIRRLLDLDAASATLDRAFASVTPGGSSAVLDAVAVALATAPEPGRRPLIVLFSDGRDSISVSTPATLLALARTTSPTVSVVLATPTRQASDSVYAQLSSETGGTLVSLGPGENLGDSFRRTLGQFRSSYVLTYVPRGGASVGAHVIDVRVKRPGVEVRARRGYVVR